MSYSVNPNHVITQNLSGYTEDLYPRLNPLGCFRGIVEDVFSSPVYIIFLDGHPVTFHDFNALRELIRREPNFSQIIASRSDCSPLPGEDYITLTANV